MQLKLKTTDICTKLYESRIVTSLYVYEIKRNIKVCILSFSNKECTRVLETLFLFRTF
jgi:hypothetical protein